MGIKIKFGTYRVLYTSFELDKYCTQVRDLFIEIDLSSEGGKKVYPSNLKPTHDMSPNECLNTENFVFLNRADEDKYYAGVRELSFFATNLHDCVNTQYYFALIHSFKDTILNSFYSIDMGLHNLYEQNYSELVEARCKTNKDISLLEEL